MPGDELFKRYLEAGAAALGISRERAEALVKELVASGEVAKGQAAKAVDWLVERGRAGSDELGEMIRREIRQQVAALGLATKDDIARIEARLAGTGPGMGGAGTGAAGAGTGATRTAAAAAKTAANTAASGGTASKAGPASSGAKASTVGKTTSAGRAATAGRARTAGTATAKSPSATSGAAKSAPATDRGGATATPKPADRGGATATPKPAPGGATATPKPAAGTKKSGRSAPINKSASVRRRPGGASGPSAPSSKD